MPAVRQHQCEACPWKKSTIPERDIPNNYCAAKHENLKRTIAEKGAIRIGGTLRLMACHETADGREQACTGWVAHQLGRGNNIALRFALLGQQLDLKLEGPQHTSFEATLPKKHRKK